MQHLWPNDSVVDGNLPNDSDDDGGNALAGHVHTVLKEVGVGLGALIVYVAYWVAAALLLHQLAS